MRTFHAVLANTLVAWLTNMFVWNAVVFWVYLQTRSVIATAVMAGAYTVAVAGSGVFVGALVDRHPKRRVMLASSAGSLALYALALAFLVAAPPAAFAAASSVPLWLFVALALGGAVAGNARGIALSTLVTILVPAAGRDRANGLVGSANGAAFLVAFPLCGLVVGFLGVRWVFVGALGLTLLIIAHLLTIAIPAGPGGDGDEVETGATGVDLRGTIRAIRRVPGLFGLIIFGTFNNFLGGVLTSLIDAYGLLWCRCRPRARCGMS
jgi:DHA3 family multidrug efflux protein-like MFS transporter